MQYNFERIKVLITSACNSNCTHCFRNVDKNTTEISWSKLKEIVDFGVANSCQLFSFSGGEFFTHLAAYDLIEYCLAQNVHVSILTNALQIDIPFFERVKNKSLVSFQVSIDGLKENHDSRRGTGAFDKTIFNVKQLYSLGYTLSAKTALDENNYADIAKIIQMPWFSNFLVLPVALSAKDCVNKVMKAEYKKFEQVIQIIYKELASININNHQCHCYPQELAIKYDGGVYPCTEAREHNEFLIGNITDRSIRDVLAEYESSPEKKFICSQAKVQACEKCLYNLACNHGCRLRALRFHGNFLSPDPFNCRVFNNEHLDTPIGQLFWGDK